MSILLGCEPVVCFFFSLSFHSFINIFFLDNNRRTHHDNALMAGPRPLSLLFSFWYDTHQDAPRTHPGRRCRVPCSSPALAFCEGIFYVLDNVASVLLMYSILYILVILPLARCESFWVSWICTTYCFRQQQLRDFIYYNKREQSLTDHIRRKRLHGLGACLLPPLSGHLCMCGEV